MDKSGGLRKVFDVIRDEWCIDVSRLRVLEFYARAGDWQTNSILGKVNRLSAWEIDSKFEPLLVANLPGADVRICDSHEEILNPKHYGEFDVIILDNPQEVYGDGGRYCEHFESLPRAVNSFPRQGIVAFNVNLWPSPMSAAWAERRAAVYGKPTFPSIYEASKFYEAMFCGIGWKSVSTACVDRHNPGLYYFVFDLVRIV